MLELQGPNSRRYKQRRVARAPSNRKTLANTCCNSNNAFSQKPLVILEYEFKVFGHTGNAKRISSKPMHGVGFLHAPDSTQTCTCSENTIEYARTLELMLDAQHIRSRQVPFSESSQDHPPYSVQIQKQMYKRNAICCAAQCWYRPCQTKTYVHTEKYSEHSNPQISPPWQFTEPQKEKAKQGEDEGTAKLPNKEHDGYCLFGWFTGRFRYDEHRNQPYEARSQIEDGTLCQCQRDLR